MNGVTVLERPFKEARYKLTVERGIIFSANAILPPKPFRKDVIKSMHDDIYGKVTAKQRTLRLQAWWPRYCKDVEKYIRCPKCTEIKTFKQTKIHTWPKSGCHGQGSIWIMHISEILVNFFILVDSFSGWPEVIKVWDRKATTVRQILRTIFARNRVRTGILRWKFCVALKENRLYAI